MAEVLTFDFVGHVIAPFLAKDFAGEEERSEVNVAFFDCIPHDIGDVMLKPFTVAIDFGFDRGSCFFLIVYRVKICANIVAFVLTKNFDRLFCFVVIQLTEVDCRNDDFKVAIALAEFSAVELFM